MVHQKVLRIIGGCILAVTFLVLGILLQSLKAALNQNVITIGRVNIALLETEGDKPESSVNNESIEYVKPGEKISRNSSILVLENSQPAYLRAKLIVTGLNESQKRELIETFSVEKGWIRNPDDGYYYYQQKVEPKEQVPFFDRIVVPERWGNIEKNIIFQVDVFAEAVEADKVIIDTTDTVQIFKWQSYEKMSELKSDVLNY